jgi:hypothetical protein
MDAVIEEIKNQCGASSGNVFVGTGAATVILAEAQALWDEIGSMNSGDCQ